MFLLSCSGFGSDPYCLARQETSSSRCSFENVAHRLFAASSSDSMDASGDKKVDLSELSQVSIGEPKPRVWLREMNLRVNAIMILISFVTQQTVYMPHALVIVLHGFLPQ